jgi:TetR/AcrR family acrAB operon transcriptional repressor
MYIKDGKEEMRRTKEDAALTREQVLRAALLCFHEQGFTATTLRDVARRANTSRGAVYWYFRDKGALLQAVVEAQYSRVGKKLMEFT